MVRGSALEMLTRIMPRILTLRGYEALLGPVDEPNYPFYQGNVMMTTSRVDVRTGKPVVCADSETVTRPFYPGVLRELAHGVGQKKAKNKPPPPLTANAAWEKFHEEGMYLAFERLLEDKIREVETLQQGHNKGEARPLDMKMSVKGPVKGKAGGPSTYLAGK